MELSEHYNSRVISPNIWTSSQRTAAYLVYFFPLNYLRITRAMLLAKQVGFWREPRHWIELGSGNGAAFLAFLDNISIDLTGADFIELSKEANLLMYEFLKQLNAFDLKKCTWHNQPLPLKVSQQSLFISSYAINELSQFPLWAGTCKDHFIIEPSLQETTRQLMNWRQKMLESHHYAWAPCTHQEYCPLIKHSKKDWCFDRFFIDPPEWFLEIEKFLPMKNTSLTYSYLALYKEPPLKKEKWGRIIGDTLKEKGKHRQAFCRSSEREFLSWLKKEGQPPQLPRGHLLYLNSVMKKGSELRHLPNDLETLDLDKPFSP